MNVLLVNGSPHERGCTDTALQEAGRMLEQAGHDALLDRQRAAGWLQRVRILRQGRKVLS